MPKPKFKRPFNPDAVVKAATRELLRAVLQEEATDLLMARKFKAGQSIIGLAHQWRKPAGEIEDSIRRVMRRQEKGKK